jgi:integrase/recombinase XerD
MGIPSISIIVRHSADCPRKDDRTYRKCNCKKWLEWFANDKQHRVSAKTRSWAIAEDVKRTKEDQYKNGNVAAAVALVTPTAPAGTGRTTIAEKIPLFVIAKRSAGRGEVTLDKYETELPRFEQFMAKRSKCYPSDITTDDLIAYQGTWDALYPSKLTRSKVQERLKSFVRFACTVAHAAEVLDKSKFQAIKIKKSDHQKADPFTDAQVDTMLAKIPVVFDGSDMDIVKLRIRLTALIHLMVSTGIAITDACRLRKADFEDGWLDINRQKTETKVRIQLSASLVEELLIVKNGNKEYVFWDGSTNLHSLTGNFQKQLRRLMKAAHCYKKGNLSHRFRDTYALYLFEHGCSITEVAEALGDSEATVRKHYKTDASDERLAKLPQRTFSAPQASTATA